MNHFANNDLLRKVSSQAERMRIPAKRRSDTDHSVLIPNERGDRFNEQGQIAAANFVEYFGEPQLLIKLIYM